MIINYMESATAGQVRLLHKAPTRITRRTPFMPGRTHLATIARMTVKNPASRKKPDFY
jgi:hypothetical protein